MIHDLTRGRITSSLLRFALPMMAGNLLQQLYNIADTLIVGRALGNSTSPLWCCPLASAACSCSTATIAPWIARACRWC